MNENVFVIKYSLLMRTENGQPKTSPSSSPVVSLEALDEAHHWGSELMGEFLERLPSW